MCDLIFYLAMNKYRKRRVHNTANLITGQAEVAPGALKVPRGTVGVTPDVISYYHTNLTLNIVDDQTAWTKGSVPVPFDQCVFSIDYITDIFYFSLV